MITCAKESLPFQTQDALFSAFILQLIRFVAPALISDEGRRPNAQVVFDRMVARGSILAPLRFKEPHQLEETLASFVPGAQTGDVIDSGHEVGEILGDGDHTLDIAMD